MSDHQQPRVQSGTPDGGRFATGSRPEPDVALSTGPPSHEFISEVGGALMHLEHDKDMAWAAGRALTPAANDKREAARIRTEHVAFLSDPDLVLAEPGTHRDLVIAQTADDVVTGKTLLALRPHTDATRRAGVDHFLALATQHDTSRPRLARRSVVRKAALSSAAALAAAEHPEQTDRLYKAIVAATDGAPVSAEAAWTVIDSMRSDNGMSPLRP